MTLKDFATPMNAKNSFVKASFGGFAGSGKTRTATDFIIGCCNDLRVNKPILIIDNEKGSRFLIPMFKEAGIEAYFKETVHLADVIEAMDLLNKGEIGFLFIDSLTKVWYKYIRDYKDANHKKFLTLQDWGKILPSWQEEFSDRFVEVEGNFVFTGRGGFTYDMEETEQENGKKKKEFVKSGVKMKLAGETPFEPDINIWMELQQEMDKDGKVIQWREAQILKDRSNTIDGKTFKNPTYKDFKPVVDYLLNVPIGKVAGASDKTNLAPSEDYSWLRQKEQREIELEKIYAIFDKLGLGTSKEDKTAKLQIFEKFTGTTSKTEFEKSNLSMLMNIKTDLTKFLAGWELSKDKQKYLQEYNLGDENVTDPNNPLGL